MHPILVLQTLHGERFLDKRHVNIKLNITSRHIRGVEIKNYGSSFFLEWLIKPRNLSLFHTINPPKAIAYPIKLSAEMGELNIRYDITISPQSLMIPAKLIVKALVRATNANMHTFKAKAVIAFSSMWRGNTISDVGDI